MNPTSPTPADSQAEDGLDRLLREYFRTQVPRHFPPLPADTVERVPMMRMNQRSLSRSRWVVAVCVALVLLGFGVLMRSHLPGNSSLSANRVDPSAPSATGTDPMSPVKTPAASSKKDLNGR